VSCCTQSKPVAFDLPFDLPNSHTAPRVADRKARQLRPVNLRLQAIDRIQNARKAASKGREVILDTQRDLRESPSLKDAQPNQLGQSFIENLGR